MYTILVKHYQTGMVQVWDTVSSMHAVSSALRIISDAREYNGARVTDSTVKPLFVPAWSDVQVLETVTA